MNDQMKELALKFLGDGPCFVRFTKKDGTERLMECTTKLDIIPADKQPKGESTRVKNESVQCVYDLEKNGWRSFSWDSVLEVYV